MLHGVNTDYTPKFPKADAHLYIKNISTLIIIIITTYVNIVKDN